ncbi:MAG: peptidylprolyl isomerase [Clostridia bacterium]|nr:peptidylprolyl isomerase [Clostridia bacterium]
MKKKIVRLISLLLAVISLMLPLASCSGVNTSAAVKYEGEKVSCSLFQYLCSLKKTEYLYEAYGLDSSSTSSSQLQDNAAIWIAQSSDGSTVGDTLKSEVLDDVKLLLYMKAYAEKEGYKLDKDQKKLVEKEFNKMVTEFGDKASFNKEMRRYGIDYDQMLEYNYLQTLAYQGMQLLFGENGTMKISEEATEKYYKENYATASYIFINTKNKTYSNGKVVALPEEEKQAKLALADTVFEKAQQGEDFASLILNYSDKESDEAFAKNGETFLKGAFENSLAEKKIWEMKSGEIARVDTDGGVYILCRKNIDMNYFESAKQTIAKALEDVKKFSLIDKVESEFELNEEFLNALNISELVHVV